MSFTYDALGRRTAKTFEGKKTRWVWDGNVPVHEWVEEIVGADNHTITGQDDATTIQVNADGGLAIPQVYKDKLTTWVFEDAGSFVPMAKVKGGRT